MPKTSPDIDPTITLTDAQLAKVEGLKADSLKWNEIQRLFSLSKRHATQPGMKITRARRNKQGKITETSRLISAEDIDIKPANMPNDFPYSFINYSGTPYMLLEGDLYSKRVGKRRGKLAINEKGELFFLKILRFHKDTIPEAKKGELGTEMPIAHRLGHAPHNQALERKKTNVEQSKFYLIMPYQGYTTLDLITENKLTPLQTIELCIQFMLQAFYIHEQGFVYRDFKPQNYTAKIDKTTGELEVFLIDYGMAAPLQYDKHILFKGSSYYKDEYFAGTVDYMTPYLQKQCELRENSPDKASEYVYNFSTDMYAAAISAGQVLQQLDENFQNSLVKLNVHEAVLLKNMLALCENIVENPIFETASPHIKNKATLKKQLQAFQTERRHLQQTKSPVIALATPNASPSKAIPVAMSAVETPQATHLIEVLLGDTPQTTPEIKAEVAYNLAENTHAPSIVPLIAQESIFTLSKQTSIEITRSKTSSPSDASILNTQNVTVGADLTPTHEQPQALLLRENSINHRDINADFSDNQLKTSDESLAMDLPETKKTNHSSVDLKTPQTASFESLSSLDDSPNTLIQRLNTQAQTPIRVLRPPKMPAALAYFPPPSPPSIPSPSPKTIIRQLHTQEQRKEDLKEIKKTLVGTIDWCIDQHERLANPKIQQECKDLKQSIRQATQESTIQIAFKNYFSRNLLEFDTKLIDEIGYTLEQKYPAFQETLQIHTYKKANDMKNIKKSTPQNSPQKIPIRLR